MKRAAFWSWSPFLLLSLLPLPASGQQDTPEAVVADCSGPISRETIDICLERARVIDETNPSAQLQSLEAQLEQRARHPEMAQSQQGNGPDQGPSGPPPGYSNESPPESPADDVTPPTNETGPRDLTPPDDNAQGPPLDNTPPPDDSANKGPGQ